MSELSDQTPDDFDSAYSAPPISPLAPPPPVAATTCPSCGQQVNPDGLCTHGCGQVLGLPPGVVLASRGKRFGGALLEALLMIVTLFIGWAIWSLVVWSDGKTPAKQILNMRVIRLHDRTVATWGTMAVRELVGRWLLGFIPFYGLVAACFVFTDTRQALWDRIAGTIVVDDVSGGLEAIR